MLFIIKEKDTIISDWFITAVNILGDIYPCSPPVYVITLSEVIFPLTGRQVKGMYSTRFLPSMQGPASRGIIFIDESDNKLKFKDDSGTVLEFKLMTSS